MTDAEKTAAAIAEAAPVVETILEALFPGVGTGAALAIKIAVGVAAKAPEAVSLYESFKAGTVPTRAELDAYAAAENGSFNRLMADIQAAKNA